MKARINAAIAGQDSVWSTQAINFFKKNFFGPSGSPYQFNTLGPAENVKVFDQKQIIAWYKKAQASRRVLAIYGDINLDETQKLLENNFKDSPKVVADISVTSSSSTTQAIAGDSNSVATLQVDKVVVQPTQQALASVVIGFEAQPVIGDPENFILDVGQTLCGGYTYPAGYLFEILRGRGLVYVVQTENRPGQNARFPGAFLALAGCQPSNVNPVVDTMLENIARLQGSDSDMQVNWFERAKRLIVTADALENETPEAQGELAALDELYGLGYMYHQHFADSISKVTLEEVRQVARRRLSRCIVTICTPEPQSVSVKVGERRYTSFPAVDLTPRGVQHGAVR